MVIFNGRQTLFTVFTFWWRIQRCGFLVTLPLPLELWVFCTYIFWWRILRCGFFCTTTPTPRNVGFFYIWNVLSYFVFLTWFIASMGTIIIWLLFVFISHIEWYFPMYNHLGLSLNVQQGTMCTRHKASMIIWGYLSQIWEKCYSNSHVYICR